MAQNKLIIFVKAPRPGTVKTRLAQSIGSKAACAAYCEMVQKMIQELSPLKDVQLRFCPDDAREEFRQWQAPDWELQPQGEGDLGERLQAAFEQAFAGGALRVLVIGSDCPAITIEDIRAAWAALETFDLVLGPARDGGYWLIGLTRLHRQLFEGIAWSTETVLRETLARARSAGLTVKLLRELNDVDTLADWEQFKAVLSPSKC